MASSIFTITAPSDSVRLDYKNHGEVVFTVTNTSGRGVRGRAKVVPANPAQGGWIKIGGEPEREFAVSGTQQFTVAVDVPKDGKPGKYSFRFDAVSVELPDEEYTQGPTISFSALPPAAAQKPTFPLWLIPILAILVLAIGGGGLWLLLRPTPAPGPSATPTPAPVSKVPVPNVGGGTAVEQAEKQIRDAGLVPTRQEQASQDFHKGQVIRTEPPAGTQVSPGDTVKLIVAGETKIVPSNLLTMSCPDAANAISGLGLIPDLVGDGSATKLDCSSAAHVSACSPLPGQPVLAGNHVELKVPGPLRLRIRYDRLLMESGPAHMHHH